MRVANDSSTSSGRRTQGAGDAAPSGPDGSVAWSLDRRLPVLIFLLLAAVVGGLSVAAYREVRAPAISRAADHLERVEHELVAGAARSNVARLAALRALAADSVIRRALAGGVPPFVVEARFAALREPTDSTLVAWRLASVGGETRYASETGWSAADSAVLTETVANATRTATEQRSALYATGERVHAWLVVPIVSEGRVLGTVAELGRVADNRGADATIRMLVDEDAHMLFTSRGSSQWVTARGQPVVAPFVRPSVEDRAVKVATPAGPVFAVQSAIPTTSWLVVLFQSEDSILRKPQEFLRRLLAAGLLVLTIATIGAWLLSRHVTRPLRDVTDAAAALAHGDYTRRVPVRGGGREVASLASTFNAMASAIGDAHATLAERNLELQRANAAKAQFLAMMSHELRTPLNAIGGFTELIELGLRGPVTPEQVEDLARIRRNKDLLLSIITDILDFTRGEAGALTVALEPVPIGSLLHEVVDIMGPQMRTKGVRLAVGDVPADAIALGDGDKIQQIVLNLLSNALKFSGAGGEVAVETSVTNDAVCIDVRDTGPGISPAQLDVIFEPFVQSDASLTRRAGGAGLGLAIARQLAIAMHGTLTVRSELGVGSTFRLELPHARRPQPAHSGRRDTPTETSQIV